MKPLDAVLDLLYPRDVSCAVCGEEAIVNERGLCAGCEKALKPCGKTDSLEYTDGFTAGVLYTDEIARAVYALKYHDARYLGAFFASLITIPGDWDAEVIVPVPLYKKRLAKRGYNQSALIARGLARELRLPVDEGLLSRVKNTPSQVAMDRVGRGKNVEGAFSASPAAAGKRVLLIDDVRTSGATLSECAKALLDAGAEKVYAAAACAAELQTK